MQEVLDMADFSSNERVFMRPVSGVLTALELKNRFFKRHVLISKVHALMQKAFDNQVEYCTESGEKRPLVLSVLELNKNHYCVPRNLQAVKTFLKECAEPELVKNVNLEGALEPLPEFGFEVRGSSKVLRDVISQYNFKGKPEDFLAFLRDIHEKNVTVQVGGQAVPLVVQQRGGVDFYSLNQEPEAVEKFYQLFEQAFNVVSVQKQTSGQRKAYDLAAFFNVLHKAKEVQKALDDFVAKKVTYTTKSGETRPLVVVTNGRSKHMARIDGTKEAYLMFYHLMGKKLSIPFERYEMIVQDELRVETDGLSSYDVAYKMFDFALDEKRVRQAMAHVYESQKNEPNAQPQLRIWRGYEDTTINYFIENTHENILLFVEKTKEALGVLKSNLSFGQKRELPELSEILPPRPGMVLQAEMGEVFDRNFARYNLLQNAYERGLTFVDERGEERFLVEPVKAHTKKGYTFAIHESLEALVSFFYVYRGVFSLAQKTQRNFAQAELNDETPSSQETVQFMKGLYGKISEFLEVKDREFVKPAEETKVEPVAMVQKPPRSRSSGTGFTPTEEYYETLDQKRKHKAPFLALKKAFVDHFSFLNEQGDTEPLVALSGHTLVLSSSPKGQRLFLENYADDASLNVENLRVVVGESDLRALLLKRAKRKSMRFDLPRKEAGHLCFSDVADCFRGPRKKYDLFRELFFEGVRRNLQFVDENGVQRPVYISVFNGQKEVVCIQNNKKAREVFFNTFASRLVVPRYYAISRERFLNFMPRKRVRLDKRRVSQVQNVFERGND